MTPAELLAARTALGLSQAALAKRLSIDVGTVSRWERGSRLIPPYLHLVIAHLSCRKRKS